ncbi:MAG: hypothetical protein EOO40_12600 [Deltaproteobacteria bacterium]|nr:MAG: hypothetical protein EOO40_12600 [Deltaproteobacteria bacterium]
MSKTYAQLAREIAALQASAQRQLAVESKGAIAKINEMIAKFQLSASDLKFASSAASIAPSAKGAKTVKTKAAAGKRSRYSDGQGNVWGGRGPRPRWLRSALAAGRSIESFLTAATQSPPSAPALPDPPVVASAPARKVSAKKRAAKRASVASKAPAATTAVKTVAKTPAAKKSGSATTDRKTT